MSGPPLPPIDLSNATKLKRLTLRSAESSIVWVTNSLKTITSRHKDLRDVSIHPDFVIKPIDNRVNLKQTVGEDNFQHWRDLDRTLNQLSELHGVRVKVVYYSHSNGKETEVHECVKELLPMVTVKFGAEIGKLE